MTLDDRQLHTEVLFLAVQHTVSLCGRVSPSRRLTARGRQEDVEPCDRLLVTRTETRTAALEASFVSGVRGVVGSG